MLILTGYITTAKGQAYDREILTRLVEEQSYPAVVAFAERLAAKDADVYLLNAAGYAAFQMSQPERAAGFYRQTLQQDSLNVQANLYVGLICKQQRRYPEAMVYFQRLVMLRAEQPKYLKYLADCFSGMKQEDSAFRYLELAYRRSASDLSIASAYADALLTRKSYGSADKVVQDGLLIDSLHQQLIGTGIRSAYQQKQYRVVIPLARRLLQPGSGAQVYTPIMYGVLATLQIQDYKQCLEFTGYLMRDGSETEQVLYYTARAHAGLKQYEMSNTFLRRCLALAISEHTEAYYIELGENMEHLKNYGKAQRFYDTARYFSGNNNILYRKALAYDAARQNEKARKAYSDFLKQSDKQDTAAVNFARKRLADL